MTNLKFFVLGFALLGLMSACSQETIVEPTPPITQPNVTPAPSYRLKKIDYSFVNRLFTYENGHISGEQWLGADGSETNRATLVYDTQGRLSTYKSQSIRPTTPWDLGTRVGYTYDGSGRLTLVQTYILQQGSSPETPITRLSTVDSLSYNSAGQVVGSLLYSYKLQGANYSTQPVQVNKTTYNYDANGNITEELTLSTPLISWGSSATARRRVLEYDDRPNPYHLIASPVFGQDGWSRNNVVKATSYLVYLFQKGEQPDFSRATPSVSDYTYTYKDNLPRQKSGAAEEAYEYETY